MGEYAGSALENYNPKLTAGEDMSAARDIAKRFEQLESQWLHFQKSSEKWEGETRLAAEQALPPICELDRTVPSTAFSYSNPLFSSHKPFKRRSAASSPRALSSARSSAILPPSQHSPDKGLLSTRQGQRVPMIPTSSERHCTAQKESFFFAASPAVAQPTTSVSLSTPLSTRITNSAAEKRPGSCENPQANGIFTPPISSPDKMTSYPPSPMYGAPCKPFPSSSSSHVFTVNTERQMRAAFLLESPVNSRNHCNPHHTFQSKLPIHECTSNMWSSSLNSPGAFTSSKPPTPDPATYSSGKGPPGLQIPGVMEELGSTEVAQSSRSPPPVTPSASSARDTELQSDGSTFEPGTNLRGSQQRSIRDHSAKMPADHRTLAERASNINSISSHIMSDDRRSVTERSAGLTATDYAPVFGGKPFKPDTQMDWKERKEISALVQHKLDHTISKVEWELRLSKRESKLRMAEETLLDEQQKLSEARLALSKCEDALSQREEAVSHLEQKRDLEATLASVESGSMVMGKLVAALRDVLVQMEKKERALHEMWYELKEACDNESCRDQLFYFDPNNPRANMAVAIDLEGIHVLAANGDSKEWCKIVINVCERLVGFLSRETHLQKWAMVLERESLRMKSLEEEIMNTKEATAEQFERAAEMMRCAEEQTRMAEQERTTLSKERESLVVWVTHLQERRKAVSECEREAASSLADVQKKAANLSAHESSIDGKALEICALQEELWATSVRLHDDQELVTKERFKLQERIRQVSARERDADSQLQGIKRSKEELEKQAEQFEKEKFAGAKKRDRACNSQRELDARLNARELTLREIESELEEKALAAESLAAQLNEREKILKSMHEHCEIERLKTKESAADLERKRKNIKDSEEAIVEAQASKKNAEESWARVSKERREADEYLKSVEDRVKAWEDRLRVKEKELQQQQFSLREIESRIQEEQDRSQALHSKLILEQETWTDELKAKQESLAKRTKILETKETEIKSDLEKLTEERRLAINEIKRFAEMEARAWAAERELQTKHDEHSQEVRKHAKEYRAQIDELEVARREVEREFEEVHTKRDELQVWQREAEETLQSRIESFTNGKEELQMQIQELKKLQLDIEQAGAQIIDRVAELDQASSKLEVQRNKVELSKGKVEVLARNLAQQQELLKSRESTLASQEEKIASALSDVKRMTVETAAKEKNVRFREQAVVDRERDLEELEARLTNERRDLEKMITEVEQHAAALKEEAASAEEISHKERLIEDKHEENLIKEKELLDYEGTLKTKALSLEEHSQALSKLEQQVQDRLQKSEDIEKGWEKLREEQAAFESQTELVKNQREDAHQWKAEQDRKAREDAQRKARLREELDRQKTEMLSKLQERESRLAVREESVQVLERQGKNHIHKDAQELRAQLNGARAELDEQRQYVEEKRRVAEAIAATIEEREARVNAKEREVGKREAVLEEKEKRCLYSSEVEQHDGSKRPADTIDYWQAHDGQVKWESQILGKEMFQDESLYRLAFDRMENPHDTSFKEEATCKRGRRSASTKQEDAMERRRLKQIQDCLHKEALKITQEKANLNAQQQELEETRKAVQDVKETLTTQLKATKQMVADAALTAQNASREREALEEERRRLEKTQKETEGSLAEKESRLLNEAKNLESMRASLFQEKAQAMDVLQKAARVVEQERMKAMETTALHKERQAEAEIKEREKQLSQTAEQLNREKVALEGEKAKLKMLHDVLERGKYEQSHAQYQPTVITEAHKESESRKLWDAPNKWREDKLSHDMHAFQQIPEMHNPADNRPDNPHEFTVPLYQQTGHSQHVGAISDTSSRAPFNPGAADRRRLSGTNTSWEDLFNGSMLLSSPESSMVGGPGIHHLSPERRIGDMCGHMHDDTTPPSKKRLENVMASLINAREASRSRLQRTENALLGFPSTSPFTTQIQQALNALSSRLTMMEQIEDGLAAHFRKAYEMESPDSDGLIVDKVQLLCRMEEQQSARAEWEEDMQQQLETISMLQAASRTSFTTPVKGAGTLDKVQSISPPFDWAGPGSGDAKHGKPHGGVQDSDMPGMTIANSGGSGSNPYQSPPEWKTAFEPLLGVDSNGLSFSPLVDYHYYPNCNQTPHAEFTGREHDGSEKFARRKLHLSPSTTGHNGAS